MSEDLQVANELARRLADEVMSAGNLNAIDELLALQPTSRRSTSSPSAKGASNPRGAWRTRTAGCASCGWPVGEGGHLDVLRPGSGTSAPAWASTASLIWRICSTCSGVSASKSRERTAST